MKPKNKQPLIPKLRFPEFKDAEEWDFKPFSKLFTIGNGRDHKHLSPGGVPVYGSGGYMHSVDDHLYDGESVCIGRKGTINNPMFLTGKFWTVDTLFYTHTFKDCFPKFIFSIFQNIDWLKHNEAGGVPSLSKTNIAKIKTAIPALPEQQKIAGCLSSVDELIAAHGRKLTALQDHKKGLMQQLFPQEGETRPRLRFPEFQDASEWGEKLLGQVIEIASGQVDPKLSPYCEFPQIGSENIESHSGKLVNVKSASDKGVRSGNYVFDENDILYSKIRPALNKVAAPSFKGICSADIYPIRPVNGGLLRIFLLYMLLSQQFLDYAIRNSERGKIPKINRDALVTYKTRVPLPPEQQRIADCLSALDDQIAVQTQKIEALQQHKKGLMQQLFPSPEGAKGAKDFSPAREVAG